MLQLCSQQTLHRHSCTMTSWTKTMDFTLTHPPTKKHKYRIKWAHKITQLLNLLGNSTSLIGRRSPHRSLSIKANPAKRGNGVTLRFAIQRNHNREPFISTVHWKLNGSLTSAISTLNFRSRVTCPVYPADNRGLLPRILPPGLNKFQLCKKEPTPPADIPMQEAGFCYVIYQTPKATASTIHTRGWTTQRHDTEEDLTSCWSTSFDGTQNGFLSLRSWPLHKNMFKLA